jgi:hypothetical protein
MLDYTKLNELSRAEAALEYVRAGYKIIPQQESAPKPIITKDDGLKGSVDRPLETEEEVREFWAKHPQANIRIVSEYISIVDIDNHEHGANGFEHIEKLGLPKTLVTNSKNGGGGHLWFHNPEGRKFRVTNAMPGIDLISGHYGLVAPPSYFGQGKPYHWQNDKAMAEFNYELLNKDKTGEGKVKPAIPEVIEDGTRNDTLTRIAGCYFAKGYSYSETEKLVIADNYTKCENPLDVVEVKRIVGSIYDADEQQKEEAIRPLKQRIEEYVDEVSGVFTTKDLDWELDINDKNEKNNRRQILYRLEKDGVIKRYGSKSGTYRKVDNDLNYINIFNARVQSIFLPLPLGLSEMVAPMPKNIIICAGSSNAGKTTFVMDLIHKILNYKAKKITDTRTFENYAISKNEGKPLSVLINEQITGQSSPVPVLFATSEMGESELRYKCSLFEGGLNSWKHDNLKIVDRGDKFQDIIEPNGINVIDFMEFHDRFWLIGEDLRAIYDKLENGIAVINIQKNETKTVGKGGSVTKEKARLYLALDNNADYGQTCRIEKCKIPMQPGYSPNNKTIDFKVVGGAKIEALSEWRYIKNAKHREKINESYEQDTNDYIPETIQECKNENLKALV